MCELAYYTQRSIFYALKCFGLVLVYLNVCVGECAIVFAGVCVSAFLNYQRDLFCLTKKVA